MSIQPDLESASNNCPTTPPAHGLLAIPSPEIDRAICALIAHIESYTDEDFETESMHVTEDEIERLVIHLVMSLTTTRIGKRLGEYLLEIREGGF